MIEEPMQKRNLSACTQVVAGLRFSDEIIQACLRQEFMQESVVYQRIIREGRQQGLQEGELIIILRLLARRLGELDSNVQERLQKLSIAELESLSEALLDFETQQDLLAWLNTYSVS